MPNFVILGAQKAASTTLLASLREHPQAWLPPDEDPFLRDPLYDPAKVGEFLAPYQGRREPALGLKCPDYLARPEVPARIEQHLGRPRLVVLLRHPVQRAISAYFWAVRWGTLPIEDPSVGLGKILDGEYRDLNPRAPEILSWGLYGQHVARYANRFGLDHLLVLQDWEVTDPAGGGLAQVFGYLGIAEGFVPEVRPRGRNEGLYDERRLRFVQRRNHLLLHWDEDRTYWNVFPPSNPVKRLYSNLVAATDRYVLARRYGNDKPALSTEVLERLDDYFREDSRALQRLLGVHYPGWPGVED